MCAFADTLYDVLEAQHRLGVELATEPAFKMLPLIREAWVIVWGDDTLESVDLVAPDGRLVAADHGADRLARAGAYRVAYLVDPPPGRWTVRAKGGGAAAYAVIQRDATHFEPRLPPGPMEGASPVVEVAASNPDGEPVTDPAERKEIEITARNEAGTFPGERTS